MPPISTWPSDAGTGALTSWTYPLECTDPDPVPLDLCEVFGMVTDGSTLYVAAGGPGGRLTALNVATGAEKGMTQSDGDFQTIALEGNTILAGGHYSRAGQRHPTGRARRAGQKHRQGPD